MSKLFVGGRPWVMFDPSKRQHREWFAEFVRNRSWTNCPVRFEVDGEPGSVETIKRILLEYYSLKEFPVAKKQHKLRLTA